MILTTQMLIDRFRNYGDPAGKIRRMVSAGEIIPVTRGIYETDGSLPGQLLAPVIYGPSYLSFEFALSHYGLIPEAVRAFTSATFGKRKIKSYENAFGRFTYRDVPAEVYPLCVEQVQEGGYAYFIASPEKALCDKLWSLSPVHSMRDFRDMLFLDLRIDRDAIDRLDGDMIAGLSARYRGSNVKYLARLLGGKANE